MIGLAIFAAVAASASVLSGDSVLNMPNDINYWRKNGFTEMVGPLRIPTDVTKTDVIQVWLKLPDGGKLSVQQVNDSRSVRDTLIYPPGTVVDRVEYSKDNLDNVGDVRGASIDSAGATIFHVFERPFVAAGQLLAGYAWIRKNDAADVVAGEALAKLFYSAGDTYDQSHFMDFNHCSRCHGENSPAPVSQADIFQPQSDSRGFFQPLSVLKDESTVREHRPYDLNADDPFISVWCGSQKVQAQQNQYGRNYVCANGEAPVGRLDLAAALQAGDQHAIAVCRSRAYLFRHMDDSAQAAFGAAFRECKTLNGGI